MKALENPEKIIEDMKEHDLTIEQTCEKFDLYHETVRKYCKKFNHTPVRKKKYPDKMLTILYDQVKKEGCTQTSICGGNKQLEKALSRFIKRRIEDEDNLEF